MSQLVFSQSWLICEYFVANYFADLIALTSNIVNEITSPLRLTRRSRRDLVIGLVRAIH